MTNITDSGPPLREQDIANLEQDLEFRLPWQYRNFLLQHNGGRPDDDVFVIEEPPDNNASSVDWFFGIQPGDINDLVSNAWYMGRRVPADLLPIACDPSGNKICLRISGPRRGAVYFWDHEEESGIENKPHWKNVYFVAASFDKFLNSLQSDTEDSAEEQAEAIDPPGPIRSR